MVITINATMQRIQQTSPLAVAYKFRWGWSKTKFAGCPCSNCKQEQPAGTKMIVLRSQYHGMLAALCPECSRPTSGVADVGESAQSDGDSRPAPTPLT